MRCQIACIVLLGLVAGCSNSTSPMGTGRVTLQLAGVTPSAAAGPTITSGEDVLTIDSVQVVARKIRLEGAEGACDAEGSGEGAGEGEGEGESTECPGLWLDPVLLEPPLDEGTEVSFTVDLPEGVYHEMMLQIHTPSDANEDAAFLTEHPEFAGLSIRVVGTFNGTAFTFESAITAVIHIDLETPVEVDAEAPTAVTLAVDVSNWFSDQGNGLLNPIDLTQQIRSLIEQNIRSSFHAFSDDDGNGEAD